MTESDMTFKYMYIIYIFIHTHIFSFIFFSIMVYYKTLNIVPCAIQWDLVA